MIQWEKSTEAVSKNKKMDYLQMWLLSIPAIRDVSWLCYGYSTNEKLRFKRGDIWK